MTDVHSALKVQNEQLARVSSSFLQLRPKLLLPVGPVLLALMLWAQVPRPQLLAIAATFVTLLGWFSFEAWFVRKQPVSHDAFCGSLLLTLAGLALLCGFSGGPRSPFLPILFAPLGIAFAAFGKDRRTAFVFAGFIAVLGYVVSSTLLWSWPLPERVSSITVVLATVLSGTLLYFGVTGLASAYRETATSLEATRSEALHAAHEQTRTLQGLGARVAHELKNPLASIKGLVQLVNERAHEFPEPRSAERLEVVLQEIARMERVFGEYLTFTRPLGEVQSTAQPLRPFLHELLDLLEGEAFRARIRLSLDCPEDLVLPFDPLRLRQALVNLCQNALLAMPDGGQLRLRVAPEQDVAVLCIEDTGQGMPKDVLSRIKEPYFSGRVGGTGLGVVIADGIVRQHGGSLQFESTLATGTRAIVTLPRLDGAERLP